MTFRPDPKPVTVTKCAFPGCAMTQIYAMGLCPYHYKIRPRRSKGEQLLDEEKAKVKPEIELKKLMKKADDIFSVFIRLRDTDADGYGKCITCTFWAFFRQMDNGHYVSRDKKPTRYDEKNCQMQCKGCNGPRKGEKEIHAAMIDKLHGPGTSMMLKRQGKNTMKELRLLYLSVIDEYTVKVGQLMKTKNFRL